MAEAQVQYPRHIKIQAGRDAAKKEVERKGTGSLWGEKTLGSRQEAG
jgi:hypothetical protein